MRGLCADCCDPTVDGVDGAAAIGGTSRMDEGKGDTGGGPAHCCFGCAAFEGWVLGDRDVQPQTCSPMSCPRLAAALNLQPQILPRPGGAAASPRKGEEGWRRPSQPLPEQEHSEERQPRSETAVPKLRTKSAGEPEINRKRKEGKKERGRGGRRMEER